MPDFPQAACQEQRPALGGNSPAQRQFFCAGELPDPREGSLPQRKLGQRPGKAAAGQVFFPLGGDPLPGYRRCLPGKRLPGPKGLLLHPEPQFRCKAGTPQDAQGIFPKPTVRIPHTAQQPVCQIPPAIKGILEVTLAAQCHGIHRKIPPGQIFPERRHKPHRFGVPVILIYPVRPEGGHLQHTALGHNADGAVLAPVLHQPVIPEQFRRAVGRTGHRQVVVMHRPSQQPIPDAAAHQPGLFALLFQALHRLCHPDGQWFSHIG